MGGGGGMRGGRGPQVDKAEVLANDFKLNADQKTAIIAIMDGAQKQADPIVKQIVTVKKQMLSVAAEGGDTGPLTQKLADLNAQALGIEVDAFSQTLAKLDAKQKSKGPQLFDEMSGMFMAQDGWHRSN